MDRSNTTDRQILRSTFIMGGSSIINSLLGVVRTKVIALMLGPSGMGLTGIYITITNLMTTLCGMGIGESGVRHIAGTLGAGDPDSISRTARTVRHVSIISGLGGFCLLLCLSYQLSRLTFGNTTRSLDVAILSITIFFGAASAGQTALIQGMRRIADLAKVSILGALLGTVLSIPAIYLLGERGIAFYLVIVSGMSFLASWWYSSKIELPAVIGTWRRSLFEAKPLLKLGLALMSGSLMSVGTQYLLRVLIVRYLGLTSAGAYHSSTTLSLVYVGIILNAMLTDFYPRLSASAVDYGYCNSLINKQVEIGLLLSVPGILAIMTFAPFVIVLFYSSKFMLAVNILRWQILGVLLQVVSWPIGFMLRAQGNGKAFFLTELFSNLTQLVLAWLGIVHFGLAGVGMAFFVGNLFYLILIYLIVRCNYGFAFTRQNVGIIVIFGMATLMVFSTPFLVGKLISLTIGFGITVVIGMFSLWSLIEDADTGMLPGLFIKIKTRVGF